MPIARINGIDLSYQVQGQGEPLVLVMGLGGTHLGWSFQVWAFKKDYQVITLDNRGVGETDDQDRPFTVGTMAEDTIGLLDYLGVEWAHFLGYSLGGIIAQLIAIDHPARVRKLILASTTAVGPGAGMSSPQLLAALGIDEQSIEQDQYGPGMRGLMPAVVDLAFNSPVLRAVLRPLSRLQAGSAGQAGLERQFRSVTGANTIDHLHRIQAPTLVITGRDDRLVCPACSELLASCIPNATLVVVEGGSHGLAVEMSHCFNQHVLDFLRAANGG